MKAIILAAGYATRLYPLTINKPKALLTINEKPIINYIVEQINTIDVVDEIYVVTNHKFIDSFADWQNEIESRAKITVLDDGTTSEQDRKGAIGDIAFVIQKMNINDELLVVAGDNFFTYPLKNYYDFYKQKDKDCVCEKDTIPLFEKYLSQGNNPDAPGNFPAWLYKQKEVYAYTFKGECYDIGTPESYQEVQALFQK